MMELKVKRLGAQAVMPEYATEGAACFDLQALEGSTVPAGHAAHFSTGLAFEVPPGHVMLVFSRSGHGFKNATRLVNCVGVIDADYRGEVKVGLMNDGGADLVVQPGDRIAQALILPVPKVYPVEADSLTETTRGSGGFGSTGA